MKHFGAIELVALALLLVVFFLGYKTHDAFFEMDRPAQQRSAAPVGSLERAAEAPPLSRQARAVYAAAREKEEQAQAAKSEQELMEIDRQIDHERQSLEGLERSIAEQRALAQVLREQAQVGGQQTFQDPGFGDIAERGQDIASDLELARIETQLQGQREVVDGLRREVGKMQQSGITYTNFEEVRARYSEEAAKLGRLQSVREDLRLRVQLRFVQAQASYQWELLERQNSARRLQEQFEQEMARLSDLEKRQTELMKNVAELEERETALLAKARGMQRARPPADTRAGVSTTP